MIKTRLSEFLNKILLPELSDIILSYIPYCILAAKIENKDRVHTCFDGKNIYIICLPVSYNEYEFKRSSSSGRYISPLEDRELYKFNEKLEYIGTANAGIIIMGTGFYNDKIVVFSKGMTFYKVNINNDNIIDNINIDKPIILYDRSETSIVRIKKNKEYELEDKYNDNKDTTLLYILKNIINKKDIDFMKLYDNKLIVYTNDNCIKIFLLYGYSNKNLIEKIFDDI